LSAATQPVHRDLGSLEAMLGADLAALAREWGVDVERIAEVTGVRSSVRRRAAFAIDLVDGTRVKGRRFESAERALSVARLRDSLGDALAPLLARRGDAFLLEWVEGRSLDAIAPPAPSLLRRCGELLGAVHRRTASPPGLERSDEVDLLAAKLERSAAVLSDGGAIDAGTARSAVASALAHRPRAAASGVILKDLCAENIVLRPDGVLVVIDEANIAVGPLDLDLARTWCRWPMERDALESFTAGYEAHRSLATFLAHFPFWATVALLGAAASRIRSQAPGADAYLRRLARLLEHLECEGPRGENAFRVVT